MEGRCWNVFFWASAVARGKYVWGGTVDKLDGGPYLGNLSADAGVGYWREGIGVTG